MKEMKNIGIWMDHSAAEIIDTNSTSNNSSIKSKFTNDVQSDAIHKGESHMHNKEQQMDEAYYKEIAGKILNYDHVVLFGPTNAKTELHNYLNKDFHFKNINIDIETADKMSENEKHAFVKKHFKQ